MTQEIKLTLDNDLIEKAEKIAIKQSLPVQQMLSEVLSRAIAVLDSDQYEQAKQSAFEEMDKGFHLGGAPISRESLYER